MSLEPLLSRLWPPLGQHLFSLYEVDVTLGGVLILAACVLAGLALRQPVRRLIQRVMVSHVDDERLMALGVKVAQIAVVVVMVGLGLELGQLVTLRQFFDAVGLVLNVQLVQLGASPVTPVTLLTVVVIFLIANWISRLLQGAIRSAMLLKLDRVDQGTIAVIERLTHYLVVALGLGVGLQTAGVDLSALFAAGAVFAVGVGFAMQNIAQNFVSGVIVLVERVIRPGDVLELEGQVVRVEEMGIRSTVVRTLSDEFLIVPNSSLAQNTIKNFTLRDPSLRVRARVGVAYASDLRLVRQVLLAAADGVEGQEPGREPVLLLRDFGSSSVDFELSIWIDDPWRRDLRASDLRDAIWWALQDAAITISFPQIDVHFDPVEALPRVIVGAAGRGGGAASS